MVGEGGERCGGGVELTTRTVVTTIELDMKYARRVETFEWVQELSPESDAKLHLLSRAHGRGRGCSP